MFFSSFLYICAGRLFGIAKKVYINSQLAARPEHEESNKAFIVDLPLLAVPPSMAVCVLADFLPPINQIKIYRVNKALARKRKPKEQRHEQKPEDIAFQLF